MSAAHYYTYNVMGSVNKKTGKYPTYKVKLRVTDSGERKLIGCNCKSREFHRYTPCKHMKLIHERLGHSL
jgi:hypothetical protein